MKAKRTPREPGKPRVAVMISQDEAVAHHVDMYHGIQQYVMEKHNWELVLDPFADDQLKADPRSYDGVIARATPLLLELVSKHEIPTVNVWQNSPVASKLPAVFVDARPAGRMAAEHLLARGFRRFGVLAYHNDARAKLMMEGFRGQFKEEGLNYTVLRVSARMAQSRAGWKRGCDRMRKWIESWELPFGVLGTYDQPVQTLANICQTEYGIAVPHELALIGFGNEKSRCDQPTLKLTSIDANCRQQGRAAAALLDRLMSGESTPPEPLWHTSADLIARQSTDVIAVDDTTLATALRYIAENCHRPIQVADVADALAVSLRSLQERFSNKLSRSISQQIEHMRIERLKRLMLHSDEPIKVLARQCGFTSMNTLHRAFQRSEGISPSQFRSERG